MIETLARKRTHAVAVATLIALIAAMFVAYLPARAATGDVTATTGWCTLEDASDPANYRITSDPAGGTPITVEVPDRGDINNDGDTDDTGIGEDADTDPDQINIPCAAANNRMAVTVTPNGSRSPTVTYHEPEVIVSFGAAARAGASIPVRAYVKYQRAEATYNANAAAYTATVSPEAGASIPAPDTVVNVTPATATTSDGSTPSVGGIGISDLILLPSASGEYTVTVNLAFEPSSDADETRPAGFVAGQATATVGEDAAVIDTKVATVTLELANSALDNPLTSTSEGKAEDGTEPASGGDIWLKLTTLNSLDKPASNGDLTGIVVFGRGATLELNRPNPTNTAPLILATPTSTTSVIGAAAPNSVSHNETDVPATTEITHTMFIKVTATDSNPAAVPVTAYINGVASNTVDLTFTGSTTAISVSEAAKTLASKSGELKFTVTGMDKAGNDGVALQANLVNYRVLDADDKAVSSNPSVAKAQTPAPLPGLPDRTDPNSVTLTVTTSATTAATSGTYTLEVTLGANAKTTQTVSFNIAGPPANIELTADPDTGSTVSETVNVTATVTDEAGVAVPDGTEVTFANTAGGGTAIISGATAKTVDGVAKALFGVSGPGTTFIYATSGDANATLTFVSTAGHVEAAQVAVADSVTLADVEADLSHGDSVTVTATVADADGNPVPNGTLVTFSLAGGGTLFSPRTVGTLDGNASADIVNLTDDIWVRAFSGAASSGTMRISVESESEEAARLAQEAEDARVAAAEQAAADAAANAAAEAEKASDAADAAADADSPEDAQSAADDAAAAATAAQTAADAAQEAADDAGTDAAQESADAAQASADDAQESADAAQQSADDAQADADAAAQAQADADAQAEADRQAEIAAGVEAALEAQVDEVSLDCLSALNGFSTWTCNVDSSASAIFGMLADRGATAVHLWNGTEWVRYSVVDGNEVPGSSDFAITEDDILYISN